MDIAEIMKAFIVIPLMVLCYALGFTLKKIKPFKDKYIPVAVIAFGVVLGLVAYFTKLPAFPADHVLMAIVYGVGSAFGAIGINQVGKQLKKDE